MVAKGRSAERKDINTKRAEEHEQLKHSNMLLNVSRKVATLQSLNEVLAILVEMVTRLLKAERSSLFLNDSATDELYSRIAQGNLSREIRLPNNLGIAGEVFQSQKGIIVDDAYSHPSFARNIDQQTGFKTKSICGQVNFQFTQYLGKIRGTQLAGSTSTRGKLC